MRSRPFLLFMSAVFRIERQLKLPNSTGITEKELIFQIKATLNGFSVSGGLKKLLTSLEKKHNILYNITRK